MGPLAGLQGLLPAMPAGTPATATPLTGPNPNPGQPREITVPAELVGGLIGPGGATINELRTKAGSQVHISVLPAATPGGPQVARISGPDPLQDAAFEMVSQKIESLKAIRAPKMPTPMPNLPPTGRPMLPPGVAPGTMPGMMTTLPPPIGGPGTPNSRELQLSPELVTGLIGPGGSTLNELRRRAPPQVHISVLPAMSPGGPQTCRISGPPELAEQAEQMVQEKLDELKWQGPGDGAAPMNGMPPGLPTPPPMQAPPGGHGPDPISDGRVVPPPMRPILQPAQFGGPEPLHLQSVPRLPMPGGGSHPAAPSGGGPCFSIPRPPMGASAKTGMAPPGHMPPRPPAPPGQGLLVPRAKAQWGGCPGGGGSYGGPGGDGSPGQGDAGWSGGGGWSGGPPGGAPGGWKGGGGMSAPWGGGSVVE